MTTTGFAERSEPIQPESAASLFPSGACDTHIHVFGKAPEFPLIEGRSYTPAPASMADYWAAYRPVGVERCVLVQPSVYGRDHALLKQTLRQAAPGAMRGVAVIFEDTPDREIEELHSVGVRGARCNALFQGGVSSASLRAIADRIRPLGWHLQLLVDVDRDHALLRQVAAMGLPVVVDHFGHPSRCELAHSPGLRTLVALVRDGAAWVKLSGGYRISATGCARDPAIVPLARALAQANADRMLWGSDWPHPGTQARSTASTELAAALFDWLPPDMVHKALVDNPSQLYWRH